VKTKTKSYNPFDYLLTQADMGEYLTQAFLDESRLSAVFLRPRWGRDISTHQTQPVVSLRSTTG
jgi:hypothetical protein